MVGDAVIGHSTENMSVEDTIAAIATPLGIGGVGIVRVSGPHSRMIANTVLGHTPMPRQVEYVGFRSGTEIFDRGIALFFSQPHSFTGEDVLELQGHGGAVVMQMLLESVLAAGARLAEPGEFTQRAFLNGKLDLAQAEAVADLIHASTREAAMSANRSLQGVFSEKINEISKEMVMLRVLVEAAIDFSEEEIDMLNEKKLLKKIDDLSKKIELLCRQSQQGRLLREGISVAIVGQPNAGKSSLLNCLTQEETAIVTPIPGTTRDVVRASIQVEGVPVHLIDTAGIRETEDEIEKIGIIRSKEQQKIADKIWLLVDIHASELTVFEKEVLDNYPDKTTIIVNKIDLFPNMLVRHSGRQYISAKTGEGIADLRTSLKTHMYVGEGEKESVFISRARHCHALKKTMACVKEAKDHLQNRSAFELAAQALRDAQNRLGEIVGKMSSDELLGEIFSQFCIGK